MFAVLGMPRCVWSNVRTDIDLDSKVHGANMGPIWGRQDPGGPHVGPMNLAIWDNENRLHEYVSNMNTPGTSLVTEINLTSIGFGVWISNYTHNFTLDVISHPYPKFNAGLVKLPLERELRID